MEVQRRSWLFRTSQTKILPCELVDLQTARFILPELIDAIQRDIGFRWLSLYWINTRDRSLEPVHTGVPTIDFIEEFDFQMGRGFSAWVAQEKKAIVLSSIHRGNRFWGNPIKSLMIAPILWKGETLGVICLGHSRFGEYTNRELAQLEKIIQAFLPRLGLQ